MTEDVDKLIQEATESDVDSTFAEEIQPPAEVQAELPSMVQPQYTNIHAKFISAADPVEYVVAATNQKNKMVAANGEVRMMSGKFYFIPVNIGKDIDSDNFANMKMFSDVSDLFDVRYIKNGFACIMPLKHNTIIKNNQRLCILW